MAFIPVEPKKPTQLGLVRLLLTWRAGGTYTAGYEVILLDEDGNTVGSAQRRGDYLVHCTNEEQRALKDIVDLARIKAQALIPEVTG